MANHLDGHHGEVVIDRNSLRKLTHIFEQFADQLRRGQITTLRDERMEPVAVLFVSRVAGFRKTVSVKQQSIALLQIEADSLVSLLAEHAHRQTGSGDRADSSIVHQPRWTMAGPAHLSLAMGRRFATNQRRIIR